MKSFFPSENKQYCFHLYHFIQLEGEESLPTMQTDVQKESERCCRRGCGHLSCIKTQGATGFQVPPWPMTTCIIVEKRK